MLACNLPLVYTAAVCTLTAPGRTGEWRLVLLAFSAPCPSSHRPVPHSHAASRGTVGWGPARGPMPQPRRAHHAAWRPHAIGRRARRGRATWVPWAGPCPWWPWWLHAPWRSTRVRLLLLLLVAIAPLIGARPLGIGPILICW
jgi:hypothetical protein